MSSSRGAMMAKVTQPRTDLRFCCLAIMWMFGGCGEKGRDQVLPRAELASGTSSVGPSSAGLPSRGSDARPGEDTISGRVVSETGEPCDGLIVELVPHDPSGFLDLKAVGKLMSRTDSAGRFSMVRPAGHFDIRLCSDIMDAGLWVARADLGLEDDILFRDGDAKGVRPRIRLEGGDDECDVYMFYGTSRSLRSTGCLWDGGLYVAPRGVPRALVYGVWVEPSARLSGSHGPSLACRLVASEEEVTVTMSRLGTLGVRAGGPTAAKIRVTWNVADALPRHIEKYMERFREGRELGNEMLFSVPAGPLHVDLLLEGLSVRHDLQVVSGRHYLLPRD